MKKNEKIEIIKKLNKLRDELDDSIPLLMARQAFPITVKVKEGLVFLGIDLIDKDLDFAEYVEFAVQNDNWVCYVEALFAIAKVWQMRHYYKKSR